MKNATKGTEKTLWEGYTDSRTLNSEWIGGSKQDFYVKECFMEERWLASGSTLAT